jgi:thiamine biosynthesis lipoprotein
MISRRRFMAISAAACVAGPARAVHRERFIALGAHAEITLPGDAILAARAFAACRHEVAAIEQAFSLWRSDSVLSQLNARGRVARPGTRFVELAACAREMAEVTRGGFDVTVQGLWQERGSVDWRGLAVSRWGARFAEDGMSATFNGIAQGYAADRVIRVLERLGYRNALANLGEFRGIGQRDDGSPWKVGVWNPVTEEITETVEVAGAVATSEPRGTLVRGKPHIVDPLGRAGARWSSVTVMAHE